MLDRVSSLRHVWMTENLGEEISFEDEHNNALLLFVLLGQAIQMTQVSMLSLPCLMLILGVKQVSYGLTPSCMYQFQESQRVGLHSLRKKS
jgi:hypothetical protein